MAFQIRVRLLLSVWLLCLELIHSAGIREPAAATAAPSAPARNHQQPEFILQRNQFKIPDEYNDQTSSAFFSPSVAPASHFERFIQNVHLSVAAQMQ